MWSYLRFPIRDIQWHEESLRDAGDEIGDQEKVAIAWHTTAIAYLSYGQFNGPAAECEVNGRIQPKPIHDYLLLSRDRFGEPYFKHKFKD